MFILFAIFLNVVLSDTETICRNFNSLDSQYFRTLDIHQKIYSKDGRWYLTLHSDGNVVGYSTREKEAFFSTATSCYDLDLNHYRGVECGNYVSFVIQSDGNLVVYGKSIAPKWATSTPDRLVSLWSTKTNGKGIGPYKLILQNDRNIVLTDSLNAILWSSNTAITESWSDIMFSKVTPC